MQLKMLVNDESPTPHDNVVSWGKCDVTTTTNYKGCEFDVEDFNKDNNKVLTVDRTTMTLEQFTDFVLANESISTSEMESRKSKAELANYTLECILKNKDLTVEKIKLPLRENFRRQKPRPSVCLSSASPNVLLNIEEWFSKMDDDSSTSSVALNLSTKSKNLPFASIVLQHRSMSVSSTSYTEIRKCLNGEDVIENDLMTPIGEWEPEDLRMREKAAVNGIKEAHTFDFHGNLPLHRAVLLRNYELVRKCCIILQLLDSNVDLLNIYGMTPLHIASRDNSVNIMGILLAYGANPFIKTPGGNNSLHIAAEFGSTLALHVLIDNQDQRIELEAPNHKGETCMMLALRYKHFECVEILFRNGAKNDQQIQQNSVMKPIHRNSIYDDDLERALKSPKEEYIPSLKRKCSN